MRSTQHPGKSPIATSVMALRLSEQKSEELKPTDCAEGESPLKTKVIAVRLTERQAEELEAVALADDVRIAEAIRSAISDHIARRRKDGTFQARLRASLERDREALEKLVQRNRNILERLVE